MTGQSPEAIAKEDIATLERGRGWLLASGVLALAVGAVAILIPVVASVGTALFIGWLLIIAAGVEVVDAFAVRHLPRTLMRLLFAVVTFAAGVFLVVAPLRGVVTLTVLLVIWFVALGVARIFGAIAERQLPGAGLTAVSGVLSLVLGVLIAVQLPSSAVWAIGLLVGVDFLMYGLTALSLAAMVKRAKQAPGGSPPAPAPA